MLGNPARAAVEKGAAAVEAGRAEGLLPPGRQPTIAGPALTTKLSEARLLAEIDLERLPRHIAVIMDGNGRWAKQRHLPRIAGHRAGIRAVRQVVEACARLGIPYLTLYAFSVENCFIERH